MKRKLLIGLSMLVLLVSLSLFIKHFFLTKQQSIFNLGDYGLVLEPSYTERYYRALSIHDNWVKYEILIPLKKLDVETRLDNEKKLLIRCKITGKNNDNGKFGYIRYNTDKATLLVSKDIFDYWVDWLLKQNKKVL